MHERRADLDTPKHHAPMEHSVSTALPDVATILSRPSARPHNANKVQIQSYHAAKDLTFRIPAWNRLFPAFRRMTASRTCHEESFGTWYQALIPGLDGLRDAGEHC
jgi:hypothetical protein